jgi:hypothetical protein
MGMQQAGSKSLRRAFRYRSEGNRRASKHQLSEAIKGGLDVGRAYVEGNPLVRVVTR